MSDLTGLLDAAAAGDGRAAADLLPLVYAELRQLAAARLADEKPGQTLQATALVHEAYLRLVGKDAGHPWNGRGHFFAAAAEAMRRILVEAARRRACARHGGWRDRVELDASALFAPAADEGLLALDEGLTRLVTEDPLAADLVKLRYFAGLTVPQAAELLGISPRKADFLWAFARAWLRREIEGE
jgi:RNA polymerase sigma factor (TIGR02999 family)